MSGILISRTRHAWLCIPLVRPFLHESLSLFERLRNSDVDEGHVALKRDRSHLSGAAFQEVVLPGELPRHGIMFENLSPDQIRAGIDQTIAGCSTCGKTFDPPAHH